MVRKADLRMSYSCVPVFATATGMWCTVIVFCTMVAALRCNFTYNFQRRYISNMIPKYNSTEGWQLRGTANTGIVKPWSCGSRRGGTMKSMYQRRGSDLGPTNTMKDVGTDGNAGLLPSCFGNSASGRSVDEIRCGLREATLRPVVVGLCI